MCLAQVYMTEEERRSGRAAVLTDVARIEVQPGGLLLQELLGEEKVVHGRISTVDFLDSVVILVTPDDEKA